METRYLVIVSGSELVNTTDFCVAHEAARLYREIGWKDVKEKEEKR
jgi:hypothetical protein